MKLIGSVAADRDDASTALLQRWQKQTGSMQRAPFRRGIVRKLNRHLRVPSSRS